MHNLTDLDIHIYRNALLVLDKNYKPDFQFNLQCMDNLLVLLISALLQPNKQSIQMRVAICYPNRINRRVRSFASF